MDPISHAVIGSAVAALAPHGTQPAAVWGALLGSEIPDMDVVVRAWSGYAGYLKEHRGVTHGVLSLVLEAAAITAALRLVWPGSAWGTVFSFTLLGCLSHVAFDCGNDYGTKAFWPFVTRRVALDIIPIVDLWVLGTIAAGWIVNAVWAGHRQAVFGVVWLVLAAYVAARMALRRKAWHLVAGHFDLKEPCGEFVPCGPGWQEEQVTIHPTLLSLTCWRYVVRVRGAFLTGRVWPLRGQVGRATRARNERDKVVDASLKAQLVGTFARWARRPRVQVDRINNLYRVSWADARYEFSEEFSPFSVYAWLDDNLRLVDEGFAPRRPGAAGRQALLRRLHEEMGRPDL